MSIMNLQIGDMVSSAEDLIGLVLCRTQAGKCQQPQNGRNGENRPFRIRSLNNLLSQGRCPVLTTQCVLWEANDWAVRGVIGSPNPGLAHSPAPEFTSIPLALGVYMATLPPGSHGQLYARLFGNSHPMAIWTSVYTSSSPLCSEEKQSFSVYEKGLIREKQLHDAGATVPAFHTQHRYHLLIIVLLLQTQKQLQSLVNAVIRVA